MSFYRIDRLPPYVFAVVDELKMELRRCGEDIVDLGMGNPDGPTPAHIVDKMIENEQRIRQAIRGLRHALSTAGS